MHWGKKLQGVDQCGLRKGSTGRCKEKQEPDREERMEEAKGHRKEDASLSGAGLSLAKLPRHFHTQILMYTIKNNTDKTL